MNKKKQNRKKHLIEKKIPKDNKDETRMKLMIYLLILACITIILILGIIFADFVILILSIIIAFIILLFEVSYGNKNLDDSLNNNNIEKNNDY
ncbi:MAG: hypothetical protein ACFFDH_12555 [Promethearchaeota archaeon]